MATKIKTINSYIMKTISRAKINNIKMYLRKYCLRANNDVVLFYEVRANNNFYCKTTDQDIAINKFEALKEFEKKTTTAFLDYEARRKATRTDVQSICTRARMGVLEE